MFCFDACFTATNQDLFGVSKNRQVIQMRAQADPGPNHLKAAGETFSYVRKPDPAIINSSGKVFMPVSKILLSGQ